MKNRIIIFVLTLCFLVTPFSVFASEGEITFEYIPSEQAEYENTPETKCKAVYIADTESGKVFYEKNAHKKMYPASTTKILTALVVLENCDINEKAKVSQRAINLVPAGYSNAKLQAGETISIYTLLQALLIPSANEAAIVLAEHVSGSVAKFAELCNKRAKELGCEKLHFVNPNGVHSKNHYCSAYDLFLVAKECQKYEAFNKIVTTKSFTIPPDKYYTRNDRTFKNRNWLLMPSSKYYCSYCTGIKTGHTDAAGECLVSSANNNGLNLICVVLGGKKVGGDNQRFSDSKNLFEYVYANYSYKTITDKNKPVKTINIDNATRDTATLNLVIQKDIRTVVPKSPESSIETSIELNEDIKAPIKKNQTLGTVTYKVDGLVYKTDLVAESDVKKQPYWILNILVAAAVILFVTFIVLIIDILNQKRRNNRERRKRNKANHK